MPWEARMQITATILGETFIQSANKTSALKEGAVPSIPAAKVGQLTTRTDLDTGVVTMAAGHGFATADKIDLFWSNGSRRNMTATVAGNLVTLDGGIGDDLPANLSDVTAMKPVEYGFTMTGNDLILLGVKSPARGFIVFVDSTPADIAPASYRFDTAGGQSWSSELGTANPFAGKTLTKVKFSHGVSTGPQVMRAEALHVVG